MSVIQIKHPIWGSNFANQVYVDQASVNGEDGHGYNTVTVEKWLGGTKQVKKYVGWIKRPATDEDVVKRQFRHHCGLLKIITGTDRDGFYFLVFLDGHVTVKVDPEVIAFRFAPEELEKNDGKPIVEIGFSGEGKRWGLFNKYYTFSVICTFDNKAQMNEYLDLTNRRAPKRITYKDVEYSATSAGTYQSSDGSTLPLLLAMYLLLSPHDQQAFVAKNPEVQSMLDDTSQVTTPHDDTSNASDDTSDGNGDGSGTDGGDGGSDSSGDGGSGGGE